jgi:hypothetical protein
MNAIEEQAINMFGGEVREFHRVEFFRNLRSGTSMGVSKDLAEKIEIFDFAVVVATAQVYVERSGYYYWAFEELENFLLKVVDLAKENSKTLFIIKEKKGELSLMAESFHRRTDALDNIYVINCNKPRNIEFNQFDDLLKVADAIVSMCHSSTTVMQAIAENVPVMAINDIHPISLLGRYPQVEVNLGNLQAALSFWLHAPREKKSEIFNQLRTDLNIGKCNGLVEIAVDLSSALHGDNAHAYALQIDS